MASCCRPEFDQTTLKTVAFWALFPDEQERQRALALNRYFVVRVRAHLLISFHTSLPRR